jgi:hypothetical protein
MPSARADGVVAIALLLTGAVAATAPEGATVLPSQLATQAETLGGGLVRSGSPFSGPALRLPATPLGTGLTLPGSLPWAGVRLLTAEALVEGAHSGALLLRFFGKGEVEPRLTISLGLLPGLRTPLAVPLSVLDSEALSLPRTPGRLKGRVRGNRIKPDEIERVEIQLEETAGPQSLLLGPIRLGDEEPSFRLPRQPLVDELGQWVAREWEGKTESDPFLGTYLTFALDEHEGASFPESWCPRGGTTATTFDATGFFRTEHDKERWWLVDPEGHGFFSLGLNAVRPGEPAAVLPGSEPLFGPLPSRGGPLGEAWGRREDPPVETYSFGLANLLRSFGPEWRNDWVAMTRTRLVAWRFNTVASGSDPLLAADADLPYVISLPAYPATETFLFRDFPDVYAQEFRDSAQRWAQHLVSFRDEPNLLGYFMCNQPKWAFGARNIAAEMLETNPGTETRRALAHWLRTRYKNDTADWSVAWGLGLRSFDEVVEREIEGAAERSEMARRDLWEFSKEMVRAYVGIPGLACHEVDPNHLNLGMRYARLSSELLYEAVGVFDVFSINAYDMEPPDEVIAEIVEKTRRPVMIGEFQFGALDRGLPSTGLRGVESQKERGIAYRRYVERAAADPGVVGTHYSILNDQPLLGRFDGENYQIGFVDVCHRPYRELTGSATRAHESVYGVMTGTREPYKGRAREIPRVARLASRRTP